ncbi:MAG: S8 family serine peptidase [Bacteroidia bacterium]
MRKLLLFTFLLYSFSSFCQQQAYWVFFTDKNQVSFNPYAYFTPEAIQRRVRNHAPVIDSTDFPVREDYVHRVAEICGNSGYTTRWFNGVGVEATQQQVAQLESLPFVKSVFPQQVAYWQPANMEPDTFNAKYDLSFRKEHQLNLFGDNLFAKNNIDGSGITIGIFDAGFIGIKEHEAFTHIMTAGKVKATYDFVRHDSDVYSHGADHGCMVMSCVSGKMKDMSLGLAPGATFILARVAREYGNQYRGEEYFIAALEWADKLGVDIINVSGGPNEKSYFAEQMDGKTALISRGANMAARKGILVVAAAGNNGDYEEPFLLPPSEADSALSITATNDYGFISSYSSYGPTPDFRRKPDLCAPGTMIVAVPSKIYKNSFDVMEGTSFSAPLVSGFAACVMQMYRDIPVMALMDTLRKNATLYPYFDYSHGYGIPYIPNYFDHPAQKQNISITADPNTIRFVYSDSCYCPSKDHPDFLYYAVEYEGKILKYHVVMMTNAGPYSIPREDIPEGSKVYVHFRNSYAEQQL